MWNGTHVTVIELLLFIDSMWHSWMVVSFVHWFRIEAIAFVEFTEFSIVVFRCGFTCFSVLSSAIRMVETCLGGA